MSNLGAIWEHFGIGRSRSTPAQAIAQLPTVQGTGQGSGQQGSGWVLDRGSGTGSGSGTGTGTGYPFLPFPARSTSGEVGGFRGYRRCRRPHGLLFFAVVFCCRCCFMLLLLLSLLFHVSAVAVAVAAGDAVAVAVAAAFTDVGGPKPGRFGASLGSDPGSAAGLTPLVADSRSAAGMTPF